LALLLFYSIVSFERENILLVIYSLVVNLKSSKLSVRHVFLGLFLLGLMVYYKAIVGFFILYLNGGEIGNIGTNSIRLTHIDPAVSLLLLSDFIDDGSNYIGYYGSFIVNTIMQIIRVFVDINWSSLGEYSTEYYTQGEMGTAFSMILESLLNFWYFGPIIIGAVITYIFYVTDKMSGIYYKLHYFIWFMFMLKFVRTELAVVLKLYIVPAIIAYYLFVYSSKIRINFFRQIK
jgi:hypothetical protein